VAAIHFPEAVQFSFGLWKMGGRDKPGHDGLWLEARNLLPVMKRYASP
jgi:hypothetical protein